MPISATLPDLTEVPLLGQPVDLPHIEKALQALFMDGSGGDANSVGLARASVINLVLYSESREGLERDAGVLAELTSEAACRSLLVQADNRSAESGCRAWVQAHCQIDRNGEKSVCSEQISFLLSGSSPGLLRNVVLANLDSDLPLAFWWRGEFSDAFEEGLYSRIDRLLFDSESWDSPRNQFIRILESQRGVVSPFVMHDFAFTRLNPIRQAVANAFDRPTVARELGSLGSVEIRFARGYRMSALYLAAWIASRLEVKVDLSQSSDSSVFCLPGRKSSASEFVLLIAELDPDRRGTVEVDFRLGGSRVEISRCQTRDFIRTLTHRSGASTEEDWLPARRMNEVALVADILNRAGRNRTHAQVLPIVQELLTLK